ncbi:MAG: universal stress protein [Anaeromyxobacter sp.]|nr:universal stress protein [Anaeromyxobacter sp.]MBL0275674.1 universal stress protein [Anaeromyxobacter sp.]
MKGLDNVWVYVEARAPAEQALAAAIEAARRGGGALTVVGAIGRSEDRVFQTTFGREILRMVRDDREARLRNLEEMARAALPPGRTRSTMLEGEVPWHSVVLHAIAHPPDVLVVPARGEDPFGPDSVTQHLFRKCPAPVWSVHPGRAPFPRRALAAVDPGAPGSVERDLARRVLELSVRMAGTGPIELHAAHAWSVPSESLIRSKFGAKRTQAFLDQQREQAREQLEALIAEAHLESSLAGTHLPAGNPAAAIPALADELDADLVVLGSAGRNGLAGILIGSTAEAIVTRLARSVAVVKPAGYVSPVRPLAAARW